MGGRKDTEEVELEGNSGGSSINDFLSSINDQMNSMMQSMPAMPRIDNLNPWTAFPFGQQSKSGGKITVVNAGPGFIEEKHYDIKPDGEIVEVTNAPRLVDNDELNHNNPMESKVLDAETEVIQPEFDPADLPADEAESDLRDKFKDEPAAASDDDSLIETVADVEKVDDAPVDNADTAGDNNVVVNKEAAMAIPLVEARPELKMDLSEVDPFLHILRNSIRESGRSCITSISTSCSTAATITTSSMLTTTAAAVSIFAGPTGLVVCTYAWVYPGGSLPPPSRWALYSPSGCASSFPPRRRSRD